MQDGVPTNTLSRVITEEALPISEARCRSWASSSTEDITHLLLECPAYSKHREKLVKDLDLALDTPTLENWKFSSMSASDQLDLLMGRSTGSALADDRADEIARRYLNCDRLATVTHIWAIANSGCFGKNCW